MLKNEKVMELNYVRNHNIKLIMSQLYKGALSCSEISEKIDITDVGARKIVKLLEQENVIRMVERMPGIEVKGRPHLRYEINKDFGYFLVIDFTYPKERFIVYDFGGNEIYREKLKVPYEYADKSELSKLCDGIARNLKEKGIDISKILNVTVAIVGQVDEKNRCMIFSSRFAIFEKDKSGDLYNIFEDAFGAPVIIKHNVAFMALGESSVNYLGRYGIAMFVYAGYGVAASVLVDGKPLVGWRGYSGEIGGTQVSEGKNLDYYSSLTYMTQRCGEYLKDASFNSLTEAYGKNPIVRKIVDEGAETLGNAIGDFVNLLGADTVMLCGESLAFGDEYIDIIKDTAKRRAIPNVEFRISQLPSPVAVGALESAKEAALSDIINDRG